MAQYSARPVEQKWQKKWKDSGIFTADIDGTDKYYNLVMFPYPSGDKLHIGHWYNFAPADSWGRYMKIKGKNVLQPMGYDSFGLPAENYAIKTGVHPKDSIEANTTKMTQQMSEMGAMWDWDKKVVTSSPEYYKWTQWVFMKLFDMGLAYKKKSDVNWCDDCKTVLANEQVQDGHCERCKNEVEKKNLNQWFLKISDYAEQLLNYNGMDWPDKTIAMQKNWIGKSRGIDITYDVEGMDDQITVYTTRPDTNFGATFIVVAPESAFVEKHFESFKDKDKIREYIKKAQQQTDIDRIAEGRKKTGVHTGLFAINNLNGRRMPIYVSDFVLAHVGTGCVVGVPGHDLRDFEFAKAVGLDVIRVVVASDGDESDITEAGQVQEHEGTMINSDFLDGMGIMEAKEAIMDHLEKKGWGKRVINYKLRDWLISRQRYWGAPIPIVYDPNGMPHPIPEEHLPWLLPEDVDFKPDGTAPLARSKELFERTEKIFGKGWIPEVDTMDTFVCSSWYFLRYPCNKMDDKPFDKAILEKWLPVDMYIGGPEHACMHLLYARFITMALHDCGLIGFNEPFKKLVHQGMVTKDGAKMSKSKGNVVSPDSFVEYYGSDVFRMYLMFMGPFTDGGDWNDKGITGVARFVDRFYNLICSEDCKVEDSLALKRAVAKLSKKITEDIEKFHFNTACSAMMEFVNFAIKNGIDKEARKTVVRLISPLAPHLAEECWEHLGGNYSVINAGWPSFDEALTVDDVVTIGVQVNGKVRGDIQISKDATKGEAIEMARLAGTVKKYLDEGEVVKEIYVPGRIVGFVVK